MVNYQNAKIYKICSYKTNEIYIGSTCEKTLARRLAKHVGDYKSWKNGKRRYTTSFKIIEFCDAYIELICDAPTDRKDQLHAIEGKYIRELDCVNKCIPGRTTKEYREKNKEAIEQKKKIKTKCVCGSSSRKDNLARHKRSKKHIAYMETQ